MLQGDVVCVCERARFLIIRGYVHFTYIWAHVFFVWIQATESVKILHKPQQLWVSCIHNISVHAHTRLQVSTWTDQKTSTHQAQVRALCRNGQQQKSAQLLVRFVFDQVMTFLVIILTFWWSRLRSSWRRWVFTKRQAIDAVDRIFDHDDF